MHAATRKVLKQMVTFITTHKNGPELYHIITALRGPDSHSSELKACGTAVLRNAIGLKGYHDNGLGYDSWSDSAERAADRAKLFADLNALYNRDTASYSDAEKKLYAEGHCMAHLRLGFEAAGLKVDADNTKVRKAKAKARAIAKRRR